jgi:hypothetical protein
MPYAKDSSIIDKRTGIFLHWTLPRYFRSAVNGKFPFVPNRWLIIRECSQKNTWVVESDCPAKKTDKGNSPYLLTADILRVLKESQDKYRSEHEALYKNDPLYVNLGAAFPLNTWTERAPKDIFLTAYSAGNPMFSAYQPHNENIFSFYDSLDGVPNDIINYYIIGWCSFEDKPKLYHSSIQGINWDLNGEVPKKDALTTCVYHDDDSKTTTWKINVAVGSNPNDAFISLLKNKTLLELNHNSSHYAEELAKAEININLISAFLGDFIQDIAKPNGEIIAADRKKEMAFSFFDGGVEYESAGNENSSDLSQLNCLNSLCSEIEEKEKELAEYRRSCWIDLSKYIFLNNLPPIPGINNTGMVKEDFKHIFDSEKSIAVKIVALSDYISKKKRALEKSIPDGVKQIKPRRYYKISNPVVLISGADIPKDSEIESTGVPAAEEVPCGTNDGDFVNLPQGVSAMINKMKDVTASEYEQSFAPLFLEWRVLYAHIPFENWEFNGTDYVLKQNVDLNKFFTDANTETIGGISPLSAHFKSVIVDKLSRMAEGLEKEITLDLSGMKFLLQELTGFNEFLNQQDIRPFHPPVDEKIAVKEDKEYLFSELLGFGTESQPEAMPKLSIDKKIPFYGMRNGALKFIDLYIYDKFGRMLTIILCDEQTGLNNADNFPVFYSESLRKIQNDYALLPPRFLESARINIDYKIHGFIIRNYIDKSLSLYSPQGEYLGEIVVRGNSTAYILPPDKQALNLSGKIADFVGSFKGKSEKEFTDLADIIDAALALSTGQTSDNLTIFFGGRPLVLAEAQLSFDFYRTPPKNISWDSNDEEPGYFQNDFKFKLGSPGTREDGLVGFFPDVAFSHFCVSGTISPKPLKIGSKTVLNLLFDPTTFVSVYTGLLPAYRFRMSGVSDILKNLETYFKFSPLFIFGGDKPDTTVYAEVPEFPGLKVVWQESGEEFEISKIIKEGYKPFIGNGYLKTKHKENKKNG